MNERRESNLARFELHHQIEDFLLREADLLDDRQFEQWLDLLTEDMRYWVPIQRNVKFGSWDNELTRAGSEINWFDEGKETLTLRVKQLMSGQHWSEEPISRTTHIVTNIRLVSSTPSAQAPAEVAVTCRFLIYRNKLADQNNFFVGKREDHLRKIDGQWRISARKAILDQSVLLAPTMPLFI
jgi:3-phenylpropionate/cinnamic acid dioxygenase small subunit